MEVYSSRRPLRASGERSSSLLEESLLSLSLTLECFAMKHIGGGGSGGSSSSLIAIPVLLVLFFFTFT
jgi:hypothetical protein